MYISRNSLENVVASKNNDSVDEKNPTKVLGNTASLQDFKNHILMNYVNGEDFIANNYRRFKKKMPFIIFNFCKN